MKGLLIYNSKEAEKCYNDLVKWNMIIPKHTSYGEQVSINPRNLKDVLELLNPKLENETRDRPPIEENLNPKFVAKPFLTTSGDKEIKGVNATYSYHKNLDGEDRIEEDDKIICYVIVEGMKKGTIHLGALTETGSLTRAALQRMDWVFKGRPFDKPEVYGLGKDIEGNRQPPKAIIDILLYFGYLITVGDRHYQRTNKQLPDVGLDAFSRPDQSSSNGDTSSDILR